jgi:hypothetical protein
LWELAVKAYSATNAIYRLPFELYFSLFVFADFFSLSFSRAEKNLPVFSRELQHVLVMFEILKKYKYD